MDLSKLANKKTLYIAIAVIVVIVVIYLLGKHSGGNKDKKVKVQVDVSDGDTVTKYDPTDLVSELNRTLTTSYYFGGTERCKALEQLNDLPNASFMATVYGYKKATGSTLIEHLDDCNWYCMGHHTGDYSIKPNYHDVIKSKIAILKQTYKEV